MRLGKRERAALKLSEHVKRAAQARNLRVPERLHYRSAWDNPFPRGKGWACGWGNSHNLPPSKVR
jgi:hypothetical protein